MVSTDGRPIDLAELAASSLILFVYPMIGRPDRPLPPGWDEVPGARGCTQQSCAFRDLYARFADLGYVVAGLSTQSPPDQREAVARLHLNFPLLADPDLRLRDALVLPTFEVAGATYYRRLTLIARERRIVKVFYPIFPPQENAPNVLAWIGTHS